MRSDRLNLLRALTPLAVAFVIPTMAQDGGKTVAETQPDLQPTIIYVLLGMAALQVVFILSLSGIMRTMGGAGGWIKKLGDRGGRASALIPLLVFASYEARAQAYQGDGDTLYTYHYFWILVALNVFLFVLLVAQINVLRGLTRALTGADAGPVVDPAPSGPTWEQRIMARLTRQKPMEQEQDILMHHEYDGIRELDNVLPPWWVWLFYGTIAWGVVYLVNVHIINIWPKQNEEYTLSMTKAQAEVDAFLAAQKSQVDERNVTLLTEPGPLAQGAAIFSQNCATCHGQLGEGTAGPNLTDAYWLHGGSVQQVFTTIKYGVSGKAMKSWKTDLKPLEMQAVASYVLSLQGTDPPNPKAPEGEPWKGDPVPSTTADSIAVADTTAAVAAQ